MLDLLRGGAEGTFGVIERELRCGVWLWKLRTNEMQWSRGYFDLLGIEPGKMTPSFAAILQVTHPDDRGPQAEVERVIKQASTIRRKFRIIRPGGSTAWIYCQIIVFVDSEGVSEKAIAICTDITASQDEVNVLRVADERYRALVRATGAVVWIAKSDGQIHEVVNCDQNGEHKAVALDTGWLQLIHPEDQAKTTRAWDEAAREKRGFDVVHRMRQPDGHFKWKRSTGQPVVDHAGIINEWLGISVDLERPGPGGAIRITGAQIRAARGLLRWSVMDLANAAGISRATIRRIEELDSAASQSDPALAESKPPYPDLASNSSFPKPENPACDPAKLAAWPL
jgi:PAS domain-containing protein